VYSAVKNVGKVPLRFGRRLAEDERRCSSFAGTRSWKPLLLRRRWRAIHRASACLFPPLRSGTGNASVGYFWCRGRKLGVFEARRGFPASGPSLAGQSQLITSPRWTIARASPSSGRAVPGAACGPRMLGLMTPMHMNISCGVALVPSAVLPQSPHCSGSGWSVVVLQRMMSRLAVVPRAAKKWTPSSPSKQRIIHYPPWFPLKMYFNYTSNYKP